MTTIAAISERPHHRRKIRLPEVLRRTGLSRSTLYELMEEGLFPAEAKAPGVRTAMWWDDEVDDWNESPEKFDSPGVRAGTPPARRQKGISAGSGKSQRPPEANGTSPQTQVSKKRPSAEMSGLEKTGMTFLGREVYRHIASNMLLLNVGFLLPEPPARADTTETKTIQRENLSTMAVKRAI